MGRRVKGLNVHHITVTGTAAVSTALHKYIAGVHRHMNKEYDIYTQYIQCAHYTYHT